MASQKPDFPALLQPGIKKLSLQQIFELTVSGLPVDPRREDLFGRFALFCSEITALGVSGYTWVDGSFLTEKFDPDDVDCVLWPTVEGVMSDENAAKFMGIVSRPYAKARFGLDLYIEYALRDFHREAYWKGVMGFCHDGVTAKGFAEVSL